MSGPSARGFTKLPPLGPEGRVFELRIRTLEHAVIQDKIGKTVMEILDEDGKKLGITEVVWVIIIGIAHAYTDTKGKVRAPSFPEVCEWLDDCDDYGALVAAVYTALALGLPGARKAVAAEEKRLAERAAAAEGREDPFDIGAESAPDTASIGTSSSPDSVSPEAPPTSSGDDPTTPTPD